eukprot:6536861-Prymnesium_polylepis.1
MVSCQAPFKSPNVHAAPCQWRPTPIKPHHGFRPSSPSTATAGTVSSKVEPPRDYPLLLGRRGDSSMEKGPVGGPYDGQTLLRLDRHIL